MRYPTAVIKTAFCFMGAFWLFMPAASLALDPVPLNLPTEILTIETENGRLEFTVEIAATNEARSRGLMYRREMADDHGMLFVFEGEGERYFWMKNTPLSLDIIFIRSDGKVGHIAKATTPFSEKTIPSIGPAHYVLEVLAGTADAQGIQPGDIVRAPALGNSVTIQ